MNVVHVFEDDPDMAITITRTRTRTKTGTTVHAQSQPRETCDPTLPGYDGGIELALGILSPYGSTGPFDAHFDNVWCDVTP